MRQAEYASCSRRAEDYESNCHFAEARAMNNLCAVGLNQQPTDYQNTGGFWTICEVFYFTIRFNGF